MIGGAQKLIIDGYNVIYADDRLRRIACRHLQRAREELIDRLKGYVHNRRVQVTVVFDGRQGMADAESVLPGKLQVVFSAANQTADDVIVGTLQRSANPQSFIVISSDMAHIGRTAKRMGCQVIGAKRFLDRLRAGNDGQSSRPQGGPQDLGDVDYWLDRFEEAEDGEE